MPFIVFLEQLQDGSAELPEQWSPASPEASGPAQAFLRGCYQREALNHPHQAPPYRPAAALWAAQLLYHSTQLLVHRQQVLPELEPLLGPFSGRLDAGALSSADLTLRHLPYVLNKMRELDPEDALLDLLLDRLRPFSFSLLGSDWRPPPTAPLPAIVHSPCLLQRYADRIIAAKDLEAAAVPVFYRAVQASLGAYEATVWPGFSVVEPNAAL